MRTARNLRQFPATLFMAALAIPAIRAEETGPVPLPTLVIVEPRVANTVPAGTFAMPVSQLRFEPLVDVQSRNMAEAQGDVTVRGGIFENTGFKVGGASLFDPQTGHYFAEIPIAPEMLSAASVLTGADNSAAGFNSTVATLKYGWRPIEPRTEVTAGAGSHGLRSGGVYSAIPLLESGDIAVLADFSASYSEGDGAAPGGDHEFSRYSARVQVRGNSSQTDVFAGYQHKFFGLRNLYTPFGVDETENLKTALFVVNHRATQSDGGFVEASALWRRNVDDYEFDRTHPGAFNPFEHDTEVFSTAIEARRPVGEATSLHARAEFAADTINSTSLTFAGFDSRNYLKGSLVAEHDIRGASGVWTVRGGAVFDDNNRGGGAFSPMLEAAFEPNGRRFRAYAQVAEASQVPGYTAIGSNAASGLFRGNPDLGREKSTNWEAGFTSGADRWQVQAAYFFRQDRGLVDWTFSRASTAARTANPVDTDTHSIETIVTRRWKGGRAILGYTWLEKEADFRGRPVDASFYALNFPRHRATLALVWEPAPWIEVRADNEFRAQAPNFLRTSNDTALTGSIGVRLFPLKSRKMEVSVVVDNLWNSGFEEIPAVPASRRLAAVTATFRL